METMPASARPVSAPLSAMEIVAPYNMPVTGSANLPAGFSAVGNSSYSWPRNKGEPHGLQ
jgi:hypothetical protein